MKRVAAILVGLVIIGAGAAQVSRSQTPAPDGAFVRAADGSTWVVSGSEKRPITWLDDDGTILDSLSEGRPIANVGELLPVAPTTPATAPATSAPTEVPSSTPAPTATPRVLGSVVQTPRSQLPANYFLELRGGGRANSDDFVVTTTLRGRLCQGGLLTIAYVFRVGNSDTPIRANPTLVGQPGCGTITLPPGSYYISVAAEEAWAWHVWIEQ